MRPAFCRSGVVVLLLGVSLAAIAARADAEVGEFPEPAVIALDADQLATLRKLVAEDDEARQIADAEAELAEAAIDDEPTPIEEIQYEGLVNTDPARVATVARLRQMADAAHLLRHWQFTGDERAAEQLRRLVVAWFTTYRVTGNDVNENKLVPLILAAEALRDGFAPDEWTAIEAFLTELGERHARVVEGHEGRLTNRFTKRLRIVAACGLAIGREEWGELALGGVKDFVAASLRADGTSHDLERRDSLGYHGSALKPPLELAMLAGEDGRALYAWESPDGGSLKKSVDYLLPYARGDEVHLEWVDTKIDLDRQRAAAGIDAYQPGRPYEPRQAMEVLEAASYFDASLLPLVRQLSDSDAERFPTWRILVNEAARPQ